MQDLELWAELSKSDVKRLGGVSARKRQRAIYFDTPEHNLHAAGLSLRLRRGDGHWLQTITAGQNVAEGLCNGIDVESPLETHEPDLSKITDKRVRRAVRKAVQGTSLHPVFEMVIQQATRKTKAKSSKLGLANEECALRTEGTATEVAELGLKAGNAESLLLAVEKLLGDHELKLSRQQSKVELGCSLAPDKTEPEKARPGRISKRNTCAEAFSVILASAIRQIAVNRQAVLQSEDPEGAHQLRIGLRRLRSALRALRPIMGSGSLRGFERSARELGRCVGVLRDADVLISGIQAPMERVAFDKSGFAELRDALVRHQQAKRDAARSALRGHQWTKLQLYLTLWPRTLGERDALDKPITKHSRRVLGKAWRKVVKLGSELERLDAENRHEMRKALKELRYQAEFFAPLFKRRASRQFIEQLKALQEVFGYINDARMAPKLVEVHREQLAGVDAAQAAGYAVGRHEADAAHVWRGTVKLWQELRESKLFWK